MMNSVTAKLGIQKHIYISEMLFSQIMRELKIGKEDGYILARSAFEVIHVGTQRTWPARAFTLGHLTHNDLAS